jgi:SAM-dependent methyltransferase
MQQNILRRILAPFSRYDEWEHWNSRSDPNAPKGWDGATLSYDVNYLRERLQGCDEILELGPGVGRTLAAHSPQSRITCYDITGNYRTQLLTRARELDLDVRLDVARSPDEPLPYEDGSFAAAVASQVFQHQRPERIERVMSELIRAAGEIIVIASYGRSKHKRSAHAFHHDYPELCARISCEMNHVRVREGRIYFVYRRP